MIQTERLLLRPYTATDAEEFLKQMQSNREHLVDYFPNMLRASDSIETTQEYLKQKSIAWSKNKGYSFGVFLKETHQFIGHISVRGIDWRVPKGEIAYFIFKNHTRQGYASETLKGFRDWCFGEKRVTRLFMKIAPSNTASIKVAENCGFLFEGTLLKDYRKREKVLIDMHLYGCTKSFSLLRTDSSNADFHQLIPLLDSYLLDKYGAMQSFYTKFNKVDNIKNVIIAYQNGTPVACGAFKEYDENTVEIKRMFLLENLRGSGIAYEVINELEYWAAELNYTHAILETGIKQPEAIRFYVKCGYCRIDNYGQYIGVNNSLCLKKKIV
ncbi:MAG: GNAT family N-acetyltransferase [Chitinophagales bacterium]